MPDDAAQRAERPGAGQGPVSPAANSPFICTRCGTHLRLVPAEPTPNFPKRTHRWACPKGCGG